MIEDDMLTIFYEKRSGYIKAYCSGVQSMLFFNTDDEEWKNQYDFIVVPNNVNIIMNKNNFYVDLETKKVIKKEAPYGDNTCDHAELIKQLAIRLSALEDINERREKEISQMITDIAINSVKTEQIKDILSEIKNSIKEIVVKMNTIETKPAQRWDDIIRVIITVSVTSFITWLLIKK